MSRTFEPEALSHGERLQSPATPISERLPEHTSSERARPRAQPVAKGKQPGDLPQPFVAGTLLRPGAVSLPARGSWMNKVLAIAGVVIKELYRRKDFYVLFVMTAVITLLMGSVRFFGDDKIVRYLKDICLLLIWASELVIAIATTARQIPAERENRTIFPLLAKPVTRWHVILGKFAGCWLACGLALVVFYLFFGVISG